MRFNGNFQQVIHMAKRAPPAELPPDLLPRVQGLEQLVERLGGLLEGTQARLQALEGLPAALQTVRDLAADAGARARDAVEMSRLSITHEDRLTNLTLAVAEGIAHVERAENRIRATVARARRELQESGVESPGLEAEARELRVIDGGRSDESEVPTMRAPVAPAPAPPVGLDDHLPSSFPGMSRGDLRRFRGA